MSEVLEQSGQDLYEKPAEVDSGKAFVRRWMEAIKLSGKEEEEWRKVASDALKVFNSDDAELSGTAFNLYHANIETIVPALYNSTPIPDIRRRFGDRDPQAKEGADAIERVLSYSIDEYDFDDVIEASVLHYAVLGRGVARVHYEAGMQEDGADVGAQRASCRVVPWKSFRRGPGQTWDDVPWVAFEHHMTKTDIEKINPDLASEVPMNVKPDGSEKDDKSNPEGDIFKRAVIWEIWDRTRREVIFIAEEYADKELARIEDPLGLKAFYPTPRPMFFSRGDDTCVPLCTYQVQKPILDEIDIISRRIRNLVRQLRPRALGPSDVDLDALANAQDGEIVGVSNIIQFLESGGMEKMLAWFPLEPTVKAIEALYQHRIQLKQDLFEVSGLADIMRGQTNPNETKGAQQIKAQWGSLRIQRAQQEVQRFARDLLRIKAEIIAEHFTPENIGAMVGAPLDPQVMAVIKDQKMRDYRIDIETDSTIRGDLTRNLESMTQFMGGTAQFMQALEPAAAIGVPPDVIVTIFSAFARNFKLGKEVDAVLDGLPEQIKQLQQQPKEPTPEEQKAQAEMAKIQAQLKALEEKTRLEIEAMQAKLQITQLEGQIKLAIKQEEADIDREKMQMERIEAAQTHQQDMVIAHQQGELQREQGELKREEMQQSHEIKLKQTQEAAAAKAKAAKMQPKAKAK